MNQKQIIVILLLSPSLLHASSCTVDLAPAATPYFNIRSQGVNAVRDLIGWQQLINRCIENKYGVVALTVEYDQTFRANQIAQLLFGNDVTCDCYEPEALLAISGSRSPNRGPNDWLADYFMLPTDFKSIVSFNPTIKNIIADLSFYIGIDSCGQHFYFKANVPFVHTRWNLNFCETVLNPGINPSVAGYYSATICATNLSRSLLLPNATAFFCGGNNDLINPLKVSKWSCGCSSNNNNKTVAAVNAVLGWNFLCCDDYHLGINVRTSAPTGTRPTGEFLFEPVVGNGHHWEVGIGVSAHTVLWQNCNDDTLSFYLEGYLTHLFKTCQTRSFDLCGKPNSRYMLAQELGPNLEDLSGCPTSTLCPNPTVSNNQVVGSFVNIGEFTPVANLTAALVDVTIAAQADLAIKFAYATPRGFEFDIGYNFWARSCEKIERTCCSSKDPLADGATWALKGDAVVYGFDSSLTGVALAPTEHCATIHAGTNGFIPGDDSTNNIPLTNPGIDNPQFAFARTPLQGLNNINGTPTHTSIQPIFLSEADVDLQGTRGISNKIFAHLGYTWEQCTNWTPFLGIGASVEFGSQKKCNTLCPTTNKKCHPCAISQWGLWIKGGLTFDFVGKPEKKILVGCESAPIFQASTNDIALAEKQQIIQKLKDKVRSLEFKLQKQTLQHDLTALQEKITNLKLQEQTMALQTEQTIQQCKQALKTVAISPASPGELSILEKTIADLKLKSEALSAERHQSIQTVEEELHTIETTSTKTDALKKLEKKITHIEEQTIKAATENQALVGCLTHRLRTIEMAMSTAPIPFMQIT